MTHSNEVALNAPEKKRGFVSDKISRYNTDKQTARSIIYHKSWF